MSEVRVGAGARRVEAHLLAEVAAWHEAVRAEPARLARPLCVLVPSSSLKDHVSALLVRELGSLAGVSVQTHWRLALRILEQAGEGAPVGAELLPVLVRQAARRVPALRAELDDLDDGYGAVAAAVSDLLDAGLDAALAEPVRERLAEGTGAAWARAAGVVEVALAVQGALAAHGLGRLPDVLARAREAFEADPARFVPGRLLIHGFADATGLVSDFLTALVRGADALVLLDRPPDPADPARPDLGARFGEPLAEALAAATGRPPVHDEEAPPAGRLAFFRAPGSDAEVRAVARRIEERLAADARPESIGVVTRTPALYAPALRVQLDRRGIPASGAGIAGPRSRLGRRVAFLLDLLRQRERMPADRFVLALRDLHPGQRADLRLGLHALGVPRVVDLAGPDVTAPLGDGASFPLPVRRGLTAGAAGDGDGDADAAREAEADEAPAERGSGAGERRAREGDAPSGPRAQRRHLRRELLETASRRARDVAHALDAADTPRPLGERLDALDALLAGELGWRRDAEAAPLFARLATLRAELPPALPVTVDELALLLDRALAGLAHEPLGGEGGGVQLLDVTEARARTFDHLFVLGLNRDHFPRVISEDPLLPDDVRRRLRDVLPELSLKERGHEEERFLFAELLSASGDVTVSWQILGDDGKAKAPSPLVERLVSPRDEIERVPTLLAPPSGAAGEATAHTAHEWTLLAALHGGDAGAYLPAALAEARARPGDAGAAVAELARLRLAAVAELDGARGDDPLLGPAFGHVGEAREDADLRRGALWVTTAEAVARCPWQGFLSRMLRLERPPDALEALPEADALLVGSLVHDVLERIVREAAPEVAEGKLSEALPRPAPWPDAATVDAWLAEHARTILFRNGIGLPGFASVLVEVARPYLEEARRLDWAAGPVQVVGAEISASVEVETSHGPLELHFRADRVDRDGEGLLLTDYKTGKTIKDTANEEKQLEAFREAVRRGKSLQAPAYARVAPRARGRYAYLKPDLAAGRDYRTGDDAIDEAFTQAMDDVAGALALGTFPPRLVGADGDEPRPCQWCELALACVRGDSGARRRVARWLEKPAPADDPRAGALRRIYDLGDAP